MDLFYDKKLEHEIQYGSMKKITHKGPGIWQKQIDKNGILACSKLGLSSNPGWWNNHQNLTDYNFAALWPT